MDAKWYRLASYDSAIVSMNDGTSAALYQRDPEHYRELLKKTVEIHAQLHREWPRLAADYRDALGDITSPEAWEETFWPWSGPRSGRGGDDERARRSAADATIRRRLPTPLSRRGPGAARGLPASLPADAAGPRRSTARYQGSVLGLLWSYINPLTQFLIYFFVMGLLFGRARTRELRDPCLLRPDHRPLLHRDVQRRHPLDRAQQVAGPEDGVPREMFPVASMLVSLFHVGPQLVILTVVCVLDGWAPDPGGMAAVLLGFADHHGARHALALLFSVATSSSATSRTPSTMLTNFVRFGVPMIYPYTLVARRFRGQPIYLPNPITEAVLLMQRASGSATSSDPE